jgi:hypothetical protein
MLPSWTATNVSIDIEMISPKQLIGECLDLAAAMLRDLMEVYYQMNTTDNPFSSQKNDFSAMVAHVLEPSRCDKLLESSFCFMQPLSKRTPRPTSPLSVHGFMNFDTYAMHGLIHPPKPSTTALPTGITISTQSL